MTAPQWDFADPFMWPVTVAAEHIDALAHTRNTHYVEWCMEAAWAHTTALGLGAEDYQRLDRAMALTHAEYDYLKATREGDQLVVGTWITDWAGKMKMTRRLQVVCEQTGETVFRGALEFVCIEISTGSPKDRPRNLSISTARSSRRWRQPKRSRAAESCSARSLGNVREGQALSQSKLMISSRLSAPNFTASSRSTPSATPAHSGSP